MEGWLHDWIGQEDLLLLLLVAEATKWLLDKLLLLLLNWNHNELLWLLDCELVLERSGRNWGWLSADRLAQIDGILHWAWRGDGASERRRLGSASALGLAGHEGGHNGGLLGLWLLASS